jgi:hypothetical protein
MCLLIAGAAQKAEQLLAWLILLHHAIADIGSIEAGNEFLRIRQGEPGLDLGARDAVGGRRQTDPGYVRKALVKNGELDIFRAEVMSPLRDAMRLVDREQRQSVLALNLREMVEEGFGHQALWRHVEQVECTAPRVAQDRARRLAVEA